jgi:hypothetical protein
MRRLCERRQSVLRSFAGHAPNIVERELDAARNRLAQIKAAYEQRRRFIWWPSAANVSLVIERHVIPRTINSLERAALSLRGVTTDEIAAVWPIVRRAVDADPLVVLAPALAACIEREQESSREILCVDATHRTAAREKFDGLANELKLRQQEIVAWADQELRPALVPLRALEAELEREAAALGRRRRAA